jgi:hypothetical protein
LGRREKGGVGATWVFTIGWRTKSETRVGSRSVVRHPRLGAGAVGHGHAWEEVEVDVVYISVMFQC